MQPQRQTFGALVRQHRRAAAMTQATLAAKAGLSVYSISNIERGVAHIPRKDTVHLLAQALHLNERERAALEQAVSRWRPDEPSVVPASPALWGVPMPRNPFFTGRDDMLLRIYATLHSGQMAQPCQSCTLSGLGGMGKTQTAVEYAYRYADAYAAVFWIQAETPETIIASMVAIARLLDLPEQQEREQKQVVAAVSRWLTHNSGWLIIFDNVEEVEPVKAVLPPAHQGTLLFTTRRQALSVSAQTIVLEKMTAEESQRFLLRRARLPDNANVAECMAPAEEAATQSIVAALDGLPLALDQAGAYIEATQCSLDEYLRLFRSSPSRLLDERESHADHPLSVLKTVTVACGQIEQCAPLAAALLTASALLAPEEIPECFFIQGAEQLGAAFVAMAADSFQFQAAIKALLTYSLIQRHPLTQTMTIHRLVQTVVQERLAGEEQQTWVERVMAAMAAVFPPSDKAQADYWRACERLMPHALACLDASERLGTDAATRASLMNHVAHYLANLARFAEADRLHQQVLQMCEQIIGMEHPLVIEALNGLARTCKEQGNYAEAESLVQRALWVSERIFGDTHPKVAGTLNNLAVLYMEQGKYAQAEPLHWRALQIWEQSFDAPHPMIATSLHNLASLHARQEKYEQAEDLYRRALEMWEQSLGAEHLKVAYPMSGLAEMYLKQGRLAEAEPLLRRALRIVDQTLGAEHLDVAYLLTFLGELYTKEQRFAEAEATYRRALCIRQRTLDAAYPLIVASVNALVDLYKTQGRYEEAELMCQQRSTPV